MHTVFLHVLLSLVLLSLLALWLVLSVPILLQLVVRMWSLAILLQKSVSRLTVLKYNFNEFLKLHRVPKSGLPSDSDNSVKT